MHLQQGNKPMNTPHDNSDFHQIEIRNSSNVTYAAEKGQYDLVAYWVLGIVPLRDFLLRVIPVSDILVLFLRMILIGQIFQVYSIKQILFLFRKGC